MRKFEKQHTQRNSILQLQSDTVPDYETKSSTSTHKGSNKHYEPSVEMLPMQSNIMNGSNEIESANSSTNHNNNNLNHFSNVSNTVEAIVTTDSFDNGCDIFESIDSSIDLPPVPALKSHRLSIIGGGTFGVDAGVIGGNEIQSSHL